MSQSRRRACQNTAEDEKRIYSRDYLPIYFRGAVPDETFSNAELDQILSELQQAETDSDADNAFKALLDSIPPEHPKRADFLHRLARGSERLNATAAERLAYAAAEHACDYRYDVFNFGETAYALNMVFVATQKVSASHPQRVLEGAMARASDDTFAFRILEFTERTERNRILTDFSNIDGAALGRAFAKRMRTR